MTGTSLAMQSRGLELEPGSTAAVSPEEQPLFSVIAATEQGFIRVAETKTCFVDYTWRDFDFDDRLPAEQPKSDPCVITTLGLKKDWLIIEAARALPGIEQTADIAALGRSLIANGYTMSLAQAEDMVERTKRGEPTGVNNVGSGNFFFVETSDESKPVAVAYVLRQHPDRPSSWGAFFHELDFDNCWNVGHCLLVRNLDASKL